MPTRLLRPLLLLLLSMNIAGLIGLNYNLTRPLFQLLTPFHLLTTTLILVYFHTEKNKSFVSFSVVTLLTGYAVEVIGVNTALLFGHYRYLSTLGFKIANVPPLIGANWLLLVYTFGYAFYQLLKPYLPLYLIALVAAIAMTAFDYIVEPTAIRLGMWDWYGQAPPLSNYLGWLGVSFFLQLLFIYLPFRKENSISHWVLAFQVVFFGIQFF